MSNTILEGLVKDKDYSFKKLLFKISKDFKLNISELLLLIFFLNQDKPLLDIDKIKAITLMEEKDILESFTSLNSKGLLLVKMEKDEKGKMLETISLENIYKAMISDINTKYKAKEEKDIYTTFEKEFGRTLSPMEYELIGAWVKSGISEEIIIGALKEATYNGVSNLRYIDRIIYEWGKKGFKNMNDVNKYMQKKTSSKDDENKVLFEYNWLEDEE